MFDYYVPMQGFRWELADRRDGPQAALFADEVERHVGRGEYRGLEFIHVRARSIINHVPSAAGLPFENTINPYRGCSHACKYCFARPTHEYLGLDAGLDFERRIVVKVNAVELARAETSPSRWSGASVALGTNTDPYQRAEGKYRLTRGILEVLVDRRNPFSILTKNTLVLRDLDLIEEAARVCDVSVAFSIGTLDEKLWRSTEPGTPHPQRRVEALAKIAARGIRVGALIAPVIPGLSDDPAGLEKVVAACVAAGASSIGTILLHLRQGVKEPFLAWISNDHPELAPRYRSLYPGAYAPRSEQRHLAETVADLVAKHGGPQRSNHRALPTPTSIRQPPVLQLGFGI